MVGAIASSTITRAIGCGQASAVGLRDLLRRRISFVSLPLPFFRCLGFITILQSLLRIDAQFTDANARRG
ncbi:hypothetical protein ACE103_20430 [Bradyrhizobium sp. ma5]|uniref:hypothetical protein n=1 Tax=Bradyrhizobium sp. ma5 TaxID=3344828 RepID=UPI0035D413FF